MSHPGNTSWNPPNHLGVPPPSTEPTPPRRNRALWIAGGLAVTLVVVLGVGWTLYAVGVFTPATSGGGSDSSAEAKPSEKPAVFALTEPLQETCDALDLSMYDEIMPEVDVKRTAGKGSSFDDNSVSCSVQFEEGVEDDGSCTQCMSVAIEATVFSRDDSQGSTEWFEFQEKYLREEEPLPDDAVTEFSGDWDKGLIGCGKQSDFETGEEIADSGQCFTVVRHGNLGLTIRNGGFAPEDRELVGVERLTALQEKTIASVEKTLAA